MELSAVKGLSPILEMIDGKRPERKGGWGGKAMTLPELIEREKKKRKELARLFRWAER